MQKLQKPWAAVAEELSEHLSRCQLSYKSLSIKANIDYFAARRALVKGVKSKSKSALKLCTFFGISYLENYSDSNIREALEKVLDGSQDQVELLAAIIWSTKGFKIARDKTPGVRQSGNKLTSGEK